MQLVREGLAELRGQAQPFLDDLCYVSAVGEGLFAQDDEAQTAETAQGYEALSILHERRGLLRAIALPLGGARFGYALRPSRDGLEGQDAGDGLVEPLPAGRCGPP